jgi:predicted flap endonuclease-1-like 5' DNA nuclease/uncharacterized protein YoxC
MPELNVIHIAIIAVMTVIGAIVGWILRGRRAVDEKAAVSAGWQDQINAQRKEHDRLTAQNKALMEQISQYQASNKDAKNRAKELSTAVQEAYARRDELQREIKDIRSNLEVAMNQRDQLRSDITAKADESASLEEKDSRIKKLQLELENWQNRLPPLIEKFRQRNEDAERLSAELEVANARIEELELEAEPGHTRIEPVRDPDALTDGRDASNDPSDDMPDDDDDDGVDDNDDDDDTWHEEEDASELQRADEEDEDDDFESETIVNGARDKLQEIKGVGPAIEKTLNEMGIFRYQQIAEMSEYDIDRIAKRLKGFRTRIYREDWIGQARDLRDQAPID